MNNDNNKEHVKNNISPTINIGYDSLSPEDKIRKMIFLELANIAIQLEINIVKEIKSAVRTCFIIGLITMALTTVVINLLKILLH